MRQADFPTPGVEFQVLGNDFQTPGVEFQTPGNALSSSHRKKYLHDNQHDDAEYKDRHSRPQVSGRV